MLIVEHRPIYGMLRSLPCPGAMAKRNRDGYVQTSMTVQGLDPLGLSLQRAETIICGAVCDLVAMGLMIVCRLLCEKSRTIKCERKRLFCPN